MNRLVTGDVTESLDLMTGHRGRRLAASPKTDTRRMADARRVADARTTDDPQRSMATTGLGRRQIAFLVAEVPSIRQHGIGFTSGRRLRDRLAVGMRLVSQRTLGHQML